MTLADCDKESIYTLGATGDTVVYVFPGGNALMERGEQQAAHNRQASSEHSTPLAKSQDDSVEQRLIKSGLITAAQHSVAAYDMQATGMSLVEALQMRGWITSDDLSALLGESANP